MDIAGILQAVTTGANVLARLADGSRRLDSLDDLDLSDALDGLGRVIEHFSSDGPQATPPAGEAAPART